MNTGSATADFSTNSSCIVFQYFKLKHNNFFFFFIHTFMPHGSVSQTVLMCCKTVLIKIHSLVCICICILYVWTLRYTYKNITIKRNRKKRYTSAIFSGLWTHIMNERYTRSQRLTKVWVCLSEMCIWLKNKQFFFRHFQIHIFHAFKFIRTKISKNIGKE